MVRQSLIGRDRALTGLRVDTGMCRAHESAVVCLQRLCRGGTEWPEKLRAKEAASNNLLGLAIIAKDEAHRCGRVCAALARLMSEQLLVTIST